MATTVSSSNVSHSSSIATTSGKAAPLGATVSREGVNFSIFSREASAVELLLFNREDDDPITTNSPVSGSL
jgi:glycogen operon protein